MDTVSPSLAITSHLENMPIIENSIIIDASLTMIVELAVKSDRKIGAIVIHVKTELDGGFEEPNRPGDALAGSRELHSFEFFPAKSGVL